MDKVKGLTATSSIIAISGGVAESAANTFTQTQFDLQLNPLDNEVFVVTAIDINLTPPDYDGARSTAVFGSLSTTSRTTLGTIGQSNVLAEARDSIQVDEVQGNPNGVAFSRMSGETPATALPYLAIIATNDFFGQVQGADNQAAKGFNFRMWGYRAKASASQYAALVQSEMLSQ
jgi:hypothetical protein|tara:strand:+ start:160 stop:684 length:525 start_codon:yes stop_codon:yes gene_type:complete